MKDARFLFNGYEQDLGKGEIFFHFAIDSKEKTIDFTEKIYFPPISSQIPPKLLKSILDNLMLILGISYWKTYCPREIIIEGNFLTKEQAEFWNIVYTKGLGEFFYKNKIDFRGLINFPYSEKVQIKPTAFIRKDRYLLGLGGGKDSIVTAELLKSENKSSTVSVLDKDFGLFTVGTSVIQEGVADVIGKKPILIKRELDSKLFELNKSSTFFSRSIDLRGKPRRFEKVLDKEKGTYNGHIPISVIYAFLGLLASVLYDYSSVVVGNEKSANYGNVEYLGEVINHQWSKSEEFETLFKEYIRKFITADISYFSPLRDMNELEVTKEFAKYPKYFKVFSSCNTNYKILKQVQNDNGGRWCGKCAKCVFVFICLSAFLPKKEVLNIFGKNLFEDKSLLRSFKELLGLENFKPFECVGTPEEMKEALSKIAQKKEFNKDFLIAQFLTPHI